MPDIQDIIAAPPLEITDDYSYGNSTDIKDYEGRRVFLKTNIESFSGFEAGHEYYSVYMGSYIDSTSTFVVLLVIDASINSASTLVGSELSGLPGAIEATIASALSLEGSLVKTHLPNAGIQSISFFYADIYRANFSSMYNFVSDLPTGVPVVLIQSSSGLTVDSGTPPVLSANIASVCEFSEIFGVLANVSGTGQATSSGSAEAVVVIATPVIVSQPSATVNPVNALSLASSTIIYDASGQTSQVWYADENSPPATSKGDLGESTALSNLLSIPLNQWGSSAEGLEPTQYVRIKAINAGGEVYTNTLTINISVPSVIKHKITANTPSADWMCGLEMTQNVTVNSNTKVAAFPVREDAMDYIESDYELLGYSGGANEFYYARTVWTNYDYQGCYSFSTRRPYGLKQNQNYNFSYNIDTLANGMTGDLYLQNIDSGNNVLHEALIRSGMGQGNYTGNLNYIVPSTSYSIALNLRVTGGPYSIGQYFKIYNIDFQASIV